MGEGKQTHPRFEGQGQESQSKRKHPGVRDVQYKAGGKSLTVYCDQCREPMKKVSEGKRNGITFGRFECSICDDSVVERVLDNKGDFTGMAYLED